MTPEDLQQQQDIEQQKAMMMPGQSSIQPSQALPMHEVNADPTKYPVDQATALHSFLRNAAGGPATGFVTTNPKSHEMAKTLAKSGHLQHHGSRPGQKGGGMQHHWSLTPKGLAAIGQGATKKPGGMGGKPGFGGQQRPGGGMKMPGMRAYGTSEGVIKSWESRPRRAVEEAKDHGYKITGKPLYTPGSGDSITMRHRAGHELTIHNNKIGSWEHVMKDGTQTRDKGPVSLVKHLGNIHLGGLLYKH